MNMKKYWSNLTSLEKEEISAACDTPKTVLSNIMNGGQKAGAVKAKIIADVTGLKPSDIRADIYG